MKKILSIIAVIAAVGIVLFLVRGGEPRDISIENIAGSISETAEDVAETTVGEAAQAVEEGAEAAAEEAAEAAAAAEVAVEVAADNVADAAENAAEAVENAAENVVIGAVDAVEDAAEAVDQAAENAKENMGTDEDKTEAMEDDMETTSGYIEYSAEAEAKAAASGNAYALFFAADWCPTCVKDDAAFQEMTLPEGTTVLKVDYDTADDMKAQYGVKSQHTYVIFKNGNMEVLTGLDAMKVAEILS